MWSNGDVVVRREILRGHVWAAMPQIVVLDEPGLLVLYTPERTPFAFGDAPLPHPYRGRTHWEGHGTLALHRPDDPYAVLAFWNGPRRTFAGWYLNFQERYRRTPIGIDTMDHEIDIWIPAGGSWEWKDEDKLVPGGRFDASDVARIRAEADAVARDLDADRRWWSDEWASWQPDPQWETPTLCEGWDATAW